MQKIIGIDPDIENCGVCELIDGKIDQLYTLTVPQLLDDVMVWHNKGYKIAIEDVERNKTTYSRPKASHGEMKKIAQDVGRVKGAARIICAYIKHHTGENPIMAPPGVGKQTKKDGELFNKITGYTKRSNEDKRDAWAVADWVYRKNPTGRSSE